jgi:branched-chain amino acid transport system ATP-binding protein
VSFSVNQNEIVGLIGPNGAGKTTIFNLITGFIRPDSGNIYFGGNRINGKTPEEICREGITRTFQIVKPFRGLTLVQNVMVGALCRNAQVSHAREKAHHWLEFVGLGKRKDETAENLPMGLKKRLEIARALATDTRFLLLDEAVGGLTSGEVKEILVLMQKLRDEGIALFIIEHVMAAIMQLAGRILVLSNSKIIAEGSPAEISRNSEVIRVYLGEDFSC